MRPPPAAHAGDGKRDDVAETLMIAFGVVVLDKLADDFAQMALAQWDDVPQAFLLDRPNEAFGVGIQVRAVRGQAQEADVRRSEQALELLV
jgi:hypothetical protein